MKNLHDMILECKKCGHKWVSRKDKLEDVKTCPKCRSTKWNNNTLYTHSCKRCKKSWESDIENPVECRYCRSSLWDVDYRVNLTSLKNVYESIGGDDNFKLK